MPGGNAADSALNELGEFFDKMTEWIPAAGGWFREMVIEWPEADYDRLYDLADHYAEAAQLYNDHLQDIFGYLNDLEAWQGDGAADAARARFQEYIDEISGMAEGLSVMHEGVQSKALEIESAKWMAIINIVMMAIALVQLILTAWTGVGLAVGAGEFATARAAIWGLMKKLLAKMWEQVFKFGFRHTLKAATRQTIQAGVRKLAVTALRSGLTYAAFVGGSKAIITGIQQFEGHDPFAEKNFWGRFGVELVDSFLAGAIGGPLTLGIQNRFTEAIAYGLGQTLENFSQMGRDQLLEAMLGKDAAKNSVWYSGMNLKNAMQGVTPAILVQGIVTDFRGGHNLGGGHLGRGVSNLFGADGARTSHPGTADLGGTHNAPSPATDGANAHTTGTGDGTNTSTSTADTGGGQATATTPSLADGSTSTSGSTSTGGRDGSTGTSGSSRDSSAGSSGSRDSGSSSSGQRDSGSSSSGQRDSGSSSGSRDSSSSGQRDSGTRSTSTHDGNSASAGSHDNASSGSRDSGSSSNARHEGTPAPATPVHPDAGTPSAPHDGTPSAAEPSRGDTGSTRSDTTVADPHRADSSSTTAH
ncbi:hypothetical protein ACFQ0D_09620, partial [Micromonospora zhanjiangensis]